MNQIQNKVAFKPSIISALIFAVFVCGTFFTFVETVTAQTATTLANFEQLQPLTTKSARRSKRQQSIAPTARTKRLLPVLNDNARLNDKSPNKVTSRKNVNPANVSFAGREKSKIPTNLVNGSVSPRKLQPLQPLQQLTPSQKLTPSPKLSARQVVFEEPTPETRAPETSATPVASSQTRRISSDVSTSRVTYADRDTSRFQHRRSTMRLRRASHFAPVPAKLVQDEDDTERREDEGEFDSVRDLQSIEDDDEESDEVEAEAHRLRFSYASDLHRPLLASPVQRALEYKDKTGVAINTKFAVSNFKSYAGMPVQYEVTRRSMNGQSWMLNYGTWRSPNFAHRPLYFEDANLERFGGERRGQALFSAAHFFASTLTLPYQIGKNHPCDLYYTSGYGRPGNNYCLRRQRPQWDRRGASFQGLITTAIIFGIL